MIEQRYVKVCPVGCNSKLEETTLILPEGALLRCPQCGQLISQCNEDRYLQSMQEFDSPAGTLPNSGSVDRRFHRNKKFLTKISASLKKAPENIRLLDVGCSSGSFLGTAIQLNYKAEGVEPAAQAASAAQARGLKVRNGLLHEVAYPDGEFDAITLFEVIEHLRDPLPLLKECHRILRPGGILLIGTGNAASWTASATRENWAYFSIATHGGHISFFTPDSLKTLARTAGFSLQRLDTRSVRFREKTKSTEPGYTLLKIAAEIVNPLASLLDRGEDMAMYLRRD